MGSEYTGKTNRMCRFVCLRKSDSSQASQGLSVMGLDMGTINSFCLDDGHYWWEISNLCILATNPRFSHEFGGATDGMYSLTEILNN